LSRKVLHKVEEQLELFTPETMAAAQRTLADALPLADDDAKAQRILMTKRALNASEALVKRYWAGKAALNAPPEQAAATLAAVAGPDCDFDFIYRQGAALDLYNLMDAPGDGSSRMQATFSKAKARLATDILNRVAQQVKLNPKNDPEELAAMEATRLFAKLPDSPGKAALLGDVLKTAACVATTSGKPLRSFTAYGKGGPAQFQTDVKVTQGKDKLRLEFGCHQPMDLLYCGAAGRDGNPWVDDSVELFFNRPGETDPAKFLQIIVNAEGRIFDQKNGAKSWDGNIAVNTAKGKDHWTAAIDVPLADLAEYTQDGAIKFNAARNKPQVKLVSGAKMRQDYEEISSWFPSFHSHADLLSRGWLLLNQD
jgi:hypothetical protein